MWHFLDVFRKENRNKPVRDGENKFVTVGLLAVNYRIRGGATFNINHQHFFPGWQVNGRLAYVKLFFFLHCICFYRPIKRSNSRLKTPVTM